MQVAIKITSLVISSKYGTLESGTIVKCGAEEAAHFVDECKAAEYVKAPEPVALQGPEPKAKKSKG